MYDVVEREIKDRNGRRVKENDSIIIRRYDELENVVFKYALSKTTAIVKVYNKYYNTYELIKVKRNQIIKA